MQERQEHQGHQKGFRAGAQSRGASGASEGFQGGRAEAGCQTSPKECIKIVEKKSEKRSRRKGLQERQEHQGHQKGFRAGAQSRDAKRHPRNALR